MIPEEWSALVLESREHVHYGRFNEALGILRAQLSTEESAEKRAQLASEIADIQRLQGHFTQAYMTASEALLCDIPSDLPITGLLIVQRALMEVMAFGSYGWAIQEVEGVFEHMLKDLRVEEYTSILV